jgi:hypothetical protein
MGKPSLKLFDSVGVGRQKVVHMQAVARRMVEQDQAKSPTTKQSINRA